MKRFRFLFSMMLLAGTSLATAQTTTINYSGALTLGGSPFTGTAEFQFTLWDAAAAGVQVGESTPESVILGVTNGLFSTGLDFGASIFTGADRWLQVQVRTNIGAFTTLLPRQAITAVPYAIHAISASSSELQSGNYPNAVTFNNPANVFAGSGAALTGLNAANLTSGLVPDARVGTAIARTNQVWLLGGNAGINTNNHFIGTTDLRPIEFRANGQRVLRLEAGGDSNDPDMASDGAPNIIGGSRYNVVGPGVTGATIAGGGAVNFNGSGYTNRVLQHYGTVGGGLANEVAGAAGIVAGGVENRASGGASVVGGGSQNVSSSTSSTVSGGSENTASGTVSVVAGGADNEAAEVASTIGGGEHNFANGWFSTIAGGRTNTVIGDFSSVGGGTGNRAEQDSSVVAGGTENRAAGYESSIGGGRDNLTEGHASTVSGGSQNRARTNYSTVIGGAGNTASGRYSTVAGGDDNLALGEVSFAAGRQAMALHRGSFVWSDSSAEPGLFYSSTAEDQFSINARGGVRLSLDTGLSVPANLTMGSSRRQMISLYGSDYGIGVQNSTAYFRSNDRFSWFRGGVHSDTENSPGSGGTVLMTLTSGGLTVNGAFVNSSDRNKKENVESVNPSEILEKVVSLPISTWNYRADEERSRHLGPMAQDFHAAFGVGPDEKHIATVDADGVALAAIQGLNRKLEADKAALEKRLAELEAVVSKLSRP